jgi:DNA-binding CsgD family transcriptional regulator
MRENQHVSGHSISSRLAAQGGLPLIDLASDVGRAALDANTFPVFILNRTGRICDANRAACTYFGQNPDGLRDTDALGVRGYSPSRRAQFTRRFDAWATGELVPFLIAWPPRTGADRFLAVPQGLLPYAGTPVVAIGLLPIGIVEAALAGDAARSTQLTQEWSKQHSSDTVAPDADSLLAQLTPREWEIARRLAEGDRVPLIVEDLGIAENTVRNHLKSIFRKLHVASQAQLVRRVKPQLRGAKGTE